MLPKITSLSKNVHLPVADIDLKVSAFKIAEEKLLITDRQ